ncbi:hemocyanin AA6 chain [Trichonephila clavipes]|nr:hemocyanin AA6 chain [Trichonephila clavipes]
MTRPTPELASPFPDFHTTPTGEHLSLDIFNVHRLPLYGGSSELYFPGVKVSSCEVKAKQTNVITAFMEKDELDLAHGINFGTNPRVKVRYHHLDHEPFSIAVTAENTSGAPKHATVRAPKYDQLGNRLLPDDQRPLFIELDKFHKQWKWNISLGVQITMA